MKTNQILASTGCLALLVSALSARAATKTFSATGAATWNSAGNWTPSGIPASGDDVIIPSGKTCNGLGAAQSCASLSLGGALTLDGFAFSVSGATVVSNGATVTLNNATGTKTFTGDMTINTNGTWNETAAAVVVFGGNIANGGGTLTAGTGVHTLSGASKTISGVFSIPSVTVSGSIQNNGSLTCATAFTASGSPTFVNGSGATLVVPSVTGFGSFTGTSASGSTVTYTANGATPVTASYNNLGLYTSGGNSSLSAINTVNGDLNIGGATIVNPWMSSLILGKGLVWNTTGTPVGSLGAVTMGGPLYVGGNGTPLLTINGVISDGGNGYSLTKIGTCAVTLNPSTPETYTGSTIVNGGTLTLDYANAATPANGIINGASASPLLFGSGIAGGGTLIALGKAGATCSQTFNGLTLAGGGNTVSNNVNGATSDTIALGAITRSAYGGNVDFGNSAAAGSITTTAGHTSNILGPWATYLGSDWAATNGTSQILALPAYTGALPTSGSAASGNYTMAANINLAASESANTLKISTANTLALGSFSFTVNGIMSTVAGTASVTSGGGTIGAGAGNEFVVYVKGGSTLSLPVSSSSVGVIGANSGGLTKSGAGQLTLQSGGSITLGYTGPTIVHQGNLQCPGITGFSSTNIQVDAGASVTVQNVSITLGSSAQTLSGSGTFQGSSGGGALTLAANATIQPGGSGKYGTLTIGGSSGAGVTVQSGATFVFDLSKNPNNTNLNDQVVYNYNSAQLTLPATLNVTINQMDGTLGVGSYTLLNSTGGQNFSQSPTVNATWLGGAPPGSYRFSVVNNRQLVLTVHQACAPPTTYAVTGTGTFCTNSGPTLGLANSDAGVTYQLFLGSTPNGPGVLSAGGATNPPTWAGLTAPGLYTVWATNGCGSSAQMSGTATVNSPPNSGFNLTGGDGCSSPGVTIGLSGSESGVSYQLQRDASNVGSPVAGTGSPISFGLQTVAGVYTVQASIAGCSTVTIAGSPASVTITATPNAPTAVSATADDSQVTVNWTAPGSGPLPTGYNVKRSTTSGSGYATLPAGTNVAGSPFTDTSAVNGTAYYYVVSALNGSCESTNSSPEAAATPNPAFSGFTITGNASPQAGAPNQLTVTAVDSTATPVTGVSGDIALSFSGLAAAPDTSLSTVSDKNGTPRNLGVPTIITFVNGVGSTASSAAVLVAHKAESATLHVTDGTHSSTSLGGSGLGLTISAGADSAYRISADTNAPVVGTTNTLTISIVDQYQNPSSFSGTKDITFGGLAAGPDGSLPTVDGTPFGTPTTITFSSPASAALIAHKVESNILLTATDGTLSASSAGGAAPTLSPTVSAASQLGIVTQPSLTATAGVAFAQQPVIAVLDTFANVVSNSTTSVTASASAGTLQGTTSVNANGLNGRAVFAGLSLTNPGSITLTFQSSGLPSTNSSAITVSAGAAVALAWTTQPDAAVYGSPFGTQPVLRTVDQFGNPTTTGLLASMPVTVTASGGGTLLGTTNQNIGTAGGNGVITFTDLAFKGVGAGKQLNASIGLTPPVSGASLWLDGSDTSASSMLFNGLKVTTWFNKGSIGGSLTNLIDGNRPTTNSINGRSVVRFTRNTPTYLTALNSRAYTNNGSQVTVLIAARLTSSQDWDGLISCASETQQDFGSLGFNILQSGAAGQRYGSQRNNSTPSFPTMTNSKPAVGVSFVIVHTNNAGTMGLYYKDATNGFDYTTFSGNNAYFGTGPYGVTRIAFGERFENTSSLPPATNPLDGDIAEVLIFNTVLTPSDLAKLEDYLRYKWMSTAYTSASSAAFAVAQATVVPNVTVSDKPYDGGITATIATRSLSGVVSGDDVNLDASGTALFSDKNFGLNKPVSITGLSLSGTTAPNYLLSTTSTNTTASITARTLTVSATGINRGYDGTTNAAVTLSDDRVSGDDLAVSYATAGFEDKAQGNAKSVHVYGISITGGTDAGNYALGNTTADATANITARSLAVTATGINRTYDGTTNAAVTLADDRISGDDLAVGYATAGFEDKGVGTNKPVHVFDISITGGADAANYSLGNTAADTTANIAVRPLTVSATGIDRNYDGTTNASVTLADNRVLGDDLTTSYAAAGFEDKAPGTNKPVHVFGISITGGADAASYALANTTADTTANIAARPLTITATGISKFNDGTTNATVTLSDDRISGDDITTAYATAGFEDSLRGTNKPVHVFGISITGGADALNYALGNTTADTVADILNNVPVVGTAQFSRPSGMSLKIKITDLLTNATDADLDTLALAGVSTTTTNGTALSTDSTYVYVQANNVADAFTYTVQDGYQGTNSGTVLVSVVANNPGQVQYLQLTNGTALVSFAGIPNYPYTAERGTNVYFNGNLRTWSTNAPAGGVFQIEDDFSDLGSQPDQAYYRLRSP